MIKKTIPSETRSTEATVTDLAPLVTLDQFHDDVTNVFLHYVRNICWMTDFKTAWAITKAPALDYEFELMNPDFKAAELELSYSHIKDTEFAKAMQRMYDFAYFGLIHLGEDSLDYESIHTWTTALLIDAAQGAVGSEWGSYGLDIEERAKRLVKVAETANARRILEGEEEFYYFTQTNRDDKCSEYLNVRDVALLSGMEEMSIRAAANPNRANQLKPTKTEHGTRFETSVVKEWLIKKKRYVPIVRRWFVKDFDLSKSYRSWDEISEGLDTRYNLLGQENGYEGIDKALAEINLKAVKAPDGAGLYLERNLINDEAVVRSLARILLLPEDLLLLRSKEAIAVETLRNIERDIKDLAGQKN